MNNEVTNSHLANQDFPLSLPEGKGSKPWRKNISTLLPTVLVLALMPVFLYGDLWFHLSMGKRLIITSVILLALVTAMRNGTVALLAFVYLVFLGGIRRWLIPVIGWVGTDPLILICPVVISLHFLGKLASRRLPTDTKLSRALFWLLLIMGAQVFNPQQGGLEVGVAGAMLYFGTILWFYVGRDAATSSLMNRMVWAVVVVGILCALYGLKQSYIGFSASEQEWLSKYAFSSAMLSGKVPRAFGFSTNGFEYAGLIGLAIVVCWAAFLRGNVAALMPLPLLGTALFLESVRTTTVETAFACFVLWAVQGRTLSSWAPRLILATILGVSGLIWSLRQVEQMDFDKDTQALVNHQTKGLLNPGDEKKSTAGIHGKMAQQGITSALSSPLGRGLGSTTSAAGKFGGTTGRTEFDLTDQFVSLGIVGGLLYCGVYVLIISNAFRFWHQSRTLASLAMLGIIVALPGGLLTMGMYPINMLVWFIIGAQDRATAECRAKQTIELRQRVAADDQVRQAIAEQPA